MKAGHRIERPISGDTWEAALIVSIGVDTAIRESLRVVTPEVAQELRGGWERGNQRLTPELKRMVVELNALRWPPSKVARWFEKQLQIPLTLQRVECYNPLKVSGQLMAPELAEHFFTKQKEFDAVIENLNFSSRAYPLQVLNDVTREATEQFSSVLFVFVRAKPERNP